MRVRHIYLSPVHNFVGHHGREPGSEPMEEVEEAECIAGCGLKGDRYFDYKPDYKGQVTFFAQEVYEQMCEQFNESGKDPSVFRRNVITSGIDLNDLIGREFEVQGIRFFGTEEAKPCYWMDRAFAQGCLQALEGKGGLRAKILSDGVLRRE